MPIRKENRKFYQGEAWEETRRRILKRASNKCEFCGKPNNGLVYVTRDGTGRWSQSLIDKYRSTRLLVKRVFSENPAKTKKAYDAFLKMWHWYGADGKDLHPAFPPGIGSPDQIPESGYLFMIKVILTIAHLNHTPGDDREENLKALCQRCHLNYDKEWTNPGPISFARSETELYLCRQRRLLRSLLEERDLKSKA